MFEKVKLLFVSLTAILLTHKYHHVIINEIRTIDSIAEFANKPSTLRISYTELKARNPHIILNELEYLNLSTVNFSILKTYYVRKSILQYMKDNGLSADIKQLNIAIEILVKYVSK